MLLCLFDMYMLRCSDISRNTALLQICGSRFRLGATGTNPSIPATTCYCGQHVQGSDIDHAMTCPKLSGSHSRRHDDWKDALSRVTARSGYSNRVEPGYNEVGTAICRAQNGAGNGSVFSAPC